jgi:hypothetical protein
LAGVTQPARHVSQPPENFVPRFPPLLHFSVILSISSLVCSSSRAAALPSCSGLGKHGGSISNRSIARPIVPGRESRGHDLVPYASFAQRVSAVPESAAAQLTLNRKQSLSPDGLVLGERADEQASTSAVSGSSFDWSQRRRVRRPISLTAPSPRAANGARRCESESFAAVAVTGCGAEKDAHGRPVMENRHDPLRDAAGP